jgi:translation initiation factor 2 beta subunit (eIF-2beta)/eIF-5
MVKKIEITLTEELERKLKLLKIWENSQDTFNKIETDHELIEFLIEEAFVTMKLDPSGQKVLW